jgi:hypothetical protein
MSVKPYFTGILTGKTTVAECLTRLDTPPYACMYADYVTQATTISVADTYYKIAGGFSNGGSNGFTFQNSCEFLCVTAGIYMFHWSLTVRNSQVDRIVEGALWLNDDAHITGKAATGTKEAVNVEYCIAGCGVATLAADDIVGLCIEDEISTGTVTMTHGNLTLHRVG